MVTGPPQGQGGLPSSAAEGLAEDAISLARRWVEESAGAGTDAAASRLAGVLHDPQGLPFTIGFVDGVLRPESLTAAAAHLHRIAPVVPDFLPWALRSAVRVGGTLAPALPAPVVPLARRALREMVGHLVVDARPNRLGPVLARLREGGSRLNLNLLGEAVLGDGEAQRRLDGVHELIRRDDVDYVSVKVSAVTGRRSPWAFEETVEETVERLLPLYLTAAANGTFVNLDMEEYRDLDLTVAVFQGLLDDPRLQGLEAGIVLQAYLPDALPALERLTAWARERVDEGGARVKVRLVKGANLPMERVEALLHGWEAAPYETKVDTDANYLRCLDAALHPESTAAVRIGVAGHNLFDIAYAWLLAGERGVRDDIEVEMLLGMAQGQAEAVAREVGPVLLYVPVVRPDEFDVAIGYLVRRLEENASGENFLSAAFDLAADPEVFARERDRFLASVARAADPALATGPRRLQDRRHESVAAPVRGEDAGTVRRVPDDGAEEDGLTEVVLGIARGGTGGMIADDTAVYARIEEDLLLGGMPGFRNTPDTDPALPGNREWARGILARAGASRSGAKTVSAARLRRPAEVDRLVTRVRGAAGEWGAQPAAARAVVLERAAAVLAGRRALLIETAVSEAGKTFSEADTEVSEAVDFAAYYAASARELDRVSGAVFVPSRLTLVVPPWNFPLAIPAGGVLAALAAGSGVVLKPAPQARRCAAVVAEALWDAGVPRDVLVLADVDEDELGEALVSHEGVDRVILTGSWETAELFRSWRPDLPLLAETSGKNAIVVAPSADLDLAAADIVRSAFGHAGQKCSAASLAILVGPVARSERLRRQLVDAARSLRVGPADDPRSDVGPLIEPPREGLRWALTELDERESWLLRPQELETDDARLAGRLWTPGIRAGVRPGSRLHREEFFGPVLGLLTARSLAHAVELQNAVDFGLTAGLHTQDPDDLAFWLHRVQAGNLYVNRGITGAIVQRQPFGGWKRSAVGAGAKAGGPNYLVGLGSWRDSHGGGSSTLHLRGLDSRIVALIEAAQPSLDYQAFDWLRRAALSDAVAWDREFGQVKDVTRLGAERNLLRYRPVPVAIRATGDADWRAVLRVAIAGIRAGASSTVSVPVGLPASVRRALGDLDVPLAVETEQEWLERIVVALSAEDRPDPAASEESGEEPPSVFAERPARVRLIGASDSVDALHGRLAAAIGGDPGLAVYAGEVTTAGRIELLPFVREQAVSLTAHRFGTPDDRFREVI